MVALWVLAILVIFAVGLGHRAAISLRLARYQRDRLKAGYLAKAGINRAIAELDKGANSNFNALTDTWSTGIDSQARKSLFENIEVNEGSGETFTVNYRYGDKYLCIEDEERKININRIDPFGKQELIELFMAKDIAGDEALNLTNTIIDWIDEDSDTASVTGEKEDKVFRNKPFRVKEELIPVLEYYYQESRDEDFSEKARQLYRLIEGLITTYTEQKININTASAEILGILLRACANTKPDPLLYQAAVEDLIVRFSSFKENKVFEDSARITEELKNINPQAWTDKHDGIMEGLAGIFTVKSNKFKIQSTGRVNQVNKVMTAIYDRKNKKLLYWHQN